MGTRIEFRRDTLANWTANNPILLAGEIGCETDTFITKFKVGDGTTAYNSLPYFSFSGAADIENSVVAKLNGLMSATNSTLSTSVTAFNYYLIYIGIDSNITAQPQNLWLRIVLNSLGGNHKTFFTNGDPTTNLQTLTTTGINIYQLVGGSNVSTCFTIKLQGRQSTFGASTGVQLFTSCWNPDSATNTTDSMRGGTITIPNSTQISNIAFSLYTTRSGTTIYNSTDVINFYAVICGSNYP